MEFFLLFPFTLAWSVLFAYLYRPQWQINYVIGAAVLLLCIGLFLPYDIFLAFWSPAGIFVVFISLSLTMPLFFPEGLLKEILSIKIPSRAELQESMAKLPTEESRQAMYIKVVREYSMLWLHRDRLFTYWNSQVLLTVFGVCALVGASVFISEFYFGIRLQQYWTKIEEQLSQFLGDNYSPELLDKTKETAILLIPSLYFITSGIFVLLYLNLARLVIARRDGQVSPFGEIMLFHLPEKTIWLFIGFAALLTTLYFLKIPAQWYSVPLNFLLVLSFLYFLNGFSIVKLFLEVRLLPGSWLLAFIFLLALIWQPLFLGILFLFFFFGLVDFFFSFRKRALQPISNYFLDT